MCACSGDTNRATAAKECTPEEKAARAENHVILTSTRLWPQAVKSTSLLESDSYFLRGQAQTVATQTVATLTGCLLLKGVTVKSRKHHH